MDERQDNPYQASALPDARSWASVALNPRVTLPALALIAIWIGYEIRKPESQPPTEILPQWTYDDRIRIQGELSERDIEAICECVAKEDHVVISAIMLLGPNDVFVATEPSIESVAFYSLHRAKYKWTLSKAMHARMPPP